jgi:hypothetical protein
MTRMLRTVLPIALLVACTSPEERAAKERLLSRPETRPAPTTFDRSSPETALRIGVEEAAARLGSFEWTATVAWTVGKGTDPATRIRVTERHRVRQLSTGEFEVENDVDPGLGAGSDSGKHVVYVDKMTYARSLYAPFGVFRERPTDRGRDARRYRDESFGLLGDLAGLFGGRLELRPAGDGTFLSRPAKRFAISLARQAGAFARSAGQAQEIAPADDDTRRRLAFLDGRIAVQASGECLLDAESGVPLKLALRGAFQVKEDPEARVEVELASQFRTIGAATPPVARPKGVLPDERKPKGVARALEAAGLKKRGEAEMGREEPAEETE